VKSYELLDAVGGIDARTIEAAERETNRRRGWIGWIAAACVGLAVMILIPILTKNKANQVSVGGIMREYKNVLVSGAEAAVEWPWEYKTLPERYSTISYAGREYALRPGMGGIGEDAGVFSEELGTGEGVGYDVYTDKEYRREIAVRKIDGISAERMIAVEMDGQFFPAMNNEYIPPATLGELLDESSLSRFLTLGSYTVYKNGQNTGTYSLSDTDFIWQTLEGCRNARFVEDEGGGRISRDRISFSVTSEVFGVYKRALYISADGYISTNSFDWAYTFFIGEDAASSILSHAERNGVKAQPEPYVYSLAGTLTEIGDGYILVDDSILCEDESDGIVFKVSATDLRVRRCIEFQKIDVGSVVVVSFTDPVIAGEDGCTIDSAISVARGYVSDGNVTVPE